MSLMWQFSTLLSEIFIKCASSLLIFALIFVIILCRMYWKTTGMYDEFPSFSLDLEVVRPILSDRKSFKNFTSFLFQKMMNGCRKFESEGLCLIWGFTPFICVFSDECVKIISNDKAAVDKAFMYEKVIEDSTGYGILISSGEAWKKSRKLVTTSLHTSMLKRSMSSFNENARLLVEKMAVVADGTPQDILGIVKKCTLDSLFESVLGINLKSLENDSKTNNFIHTFPKLFEFTIRRFAFPWLHYKSLLPLFADGREYLKCKEEVTKFIEFVTQEMIKSVSSSIQDDTADGEEYSRKSLPQLLFERYQNDPTFNLQDEILNLIIAGYDTVAYSMFWCLFMLSHHRDVQEKVFDEIRSLPEGNLTYDDVSKLTYMTCVIKESIRLYPPVPLYARQLSEDVQCGKYLIPKGAEIIIIPYLLHRNPHCYPNPEKFNPDRFSVSSEVRPWSFVPFSEGIRNCVGKRFAMMEMKVLLTHIIRNFEITSPIQPDDLELCWDIMLTPARRHLFQLKPRRI